MFNRVFDLPVVIVRPGNAYGEEQRPLAGQGFISTAIHLAAKGSEVEIYGAEGTVRDYIHVSDVAAGIVAALENGLPGEIYNIGTGEGSTNLDVLKAIEPLALRAGLAVRTTHSAARKFDVQANVLNSAKLRAISDWRPSVLLRDGVARVWHAVILSQRF
jgi:UDP-glucose 4-epimerase